MVDCDPPAPQGHTVEIHPSFFYLVSQNLDLSTKRMIHEGPLTWKVSKDKQIGKKHELRTPLFLNYYVNTFFLPPSEIQALLLSDCLVLLQRGPDDRLMLRYPSRWLSGGGTSGGDSKTSFSPLVKLDSLLVRSVATGNGTFSTTSFLCNSTA